MTDFAWASNDEIVNGLRHKQRLFEKLKSHFLARIERFTM
jgi:hypothetical protein